MCMTSGETATAFDLKQILKDLMPCKYAAIRLCERPQQVSAAALWNCGATLAAAPQEEIGIQGNELVIEFRVFQFGSSKARRLGIVIAGVAIIFLILVLMFGRG